MNNELPQQPSSQQVKSSLNTSGMREAVVKQLQKDLEWELNLVDFSNAEFFDIVLDKLITYFSNIIDNQPNKLAQIIYRVDINEAKLKRVLAKKHHSSAKVLAEMTLERIMLKVFYRNVYNGNIAL
jgi:hypothetical protein